MNQSPIPTANTRTRELITLSALAADTGTLSLELGTDWESPIGYEESESMQADCIARLCALENQHGRLRGKAGK